MTQNNIKLKFDEFKNLSDEDKIKYVLHIYQEKEIFDGVRNEFLENYGEHPKISQVIVDNYGVGDAPILILTLKKGLGKIKLPKYFMGFYIHKRYESQGQKPYQSK